MTETEISVRARTHRERQQVPGRSDPWPARRGEPWSVAEDRRLLRMVRQLRRRGLRGWLFWAAVAKLHSRSACSVATRYQTVQAAVRWCRVERKVAGQE
jgi:hypothetical protein